MSSIGTPVFSEWREVVSELRSTYGGDISIVLVGSVARGRSTEESDIDFLVIGDRPLQAVSHLPRSHVQISSESEFMHSLARGEDFEAWSVRYGLPLHDSGAWARILRSAEASSWPKWQAKIPHAARRLFIASVLLKMGDTDAATEETIYALCHVARALLLRAGVFPLSRPELAEQIGALGYARLAQLHDELRRPSGPAVTAIRLAQRYSKKLLLHLDRVAYARCSKEYRERLRAKHRRPA